MAVFSKLAGRYYTAKLSTPLTKDIGGNQFVHFEASEAGKLIHSNYRNLFTGRYNSVRSVYRA